MSKLAIKGGNKIVNIKPPHYRWPVITQATEESVLSQLKKSISIYNRSGIIEELEEKFKKYYNRKYALLTNSGTTALYSMYIAAGLKEGNEVICPTYTFFATVTPLFFTGAIPILVDCDESGNINPNKIEEKITEKTKAIVVTHMWGIPCEMEEIEKIAREYNLLLFEDASHAHGAKYKDRKVGTFGDVSVFSLQAQKLIPAGEGGVLLTNNEEIYYRALLLGHYNKRCKQEIPSAYELYRYSTTGMGLKLRIHPLAAAIASKQFENLEKVLRGKRKNAKYILEKISEFTCLRPPQFKDYMEPSWYAFVFHYLSEKLYNIPIDKFYEALKAEGCEELDRPNSTCPVNYHPLFQNPGELFTQYKGKIKYKRGDFPTAEKFHETSLKLPVWHEDSDKEIIDLYLRALEKVTQNYKELI
ncbi:MAG: DegT/DnrJ/EryC1/StrS family aminotransferase [Candidatus Aenigmatarchaeota archaeon]|nr:MAG: DegT/DnrJ/EryC1/StrS family aminotransferase [Candidatus Aenigmarchaeota archaeon]